MTFKKYLSNKNPVRSNRPPDPERSMLSEVNYHHMKQRAFSKREKDGRERDDYEEYCELCGRQTVWEEIMFRGWLTCTCRSCGLQYERECEE